MTTTASDRWRALGAILRPDASRWAVLGALVATGAGAALAGPLVVRRVIDRATAGAGGGEITRLAALFLVLAIFTQLVAVAIAWYATVAAWTTTNALRMRMAGHVLDLDHEFHRRHTPGELIQRVDGDVTAVSDFISQVVPKAAGAAFTVLGMVAVLVVLDWRVALGMLAYLAVSTAVVLRSRHRAVAESSDEMGALAQLYGGIEERLTAAEDLRSNGAADHIAWRFIEDSTAALSSGVRRERAFLVMWWLVQSAVAAGWILVLIVGASLVSAGAITLGTAFLLYQYVLLISRPLEDVVHQLETVQKANGAMLRVADLMATHATIIDGGSTSPAAGPLEIVCAGVHFDYGDDQPVLTDIDVTLRAGRSVGIVGRTGSGKTTFSRLVLRLIEVTDGTLRLGGVPINEIPITELRHRVALVPQEVELFAGTIRDNVTLFDHVPTDEQVIEALSSVGLDRLADDGIHRSLGAGGAGLSAGEAQLLALARVWLRRPDLVVLDEATARVDPETEALLERAIAQLIRGRTALVIAHRLSTLRHVDDIAVFEHGRIVEFGDRDALAANDASRFAELLALALEDDESAVGAPTERGANSIGTIPRHDAIGQWK